MLTSIEEYRGRVSAFLAEMVIPRAESLEQAGASPRPLFQEMGRLGLFAPCLRPLGDPSEARLAPEWRCFRVLIEELAKTGCFGLTLTVSMHVGVFLPMVSQTAPGCSSEEICAAGIRGEILGTMAVTEAGVAGSDFLGMRSRLSFAPDHLTLSGEKYLVTNGAIADYAIVFARWREERHFASHCAVLLPMSLEGVHAARIELDVMRTAVVSGLRFDDVRLDPGHLLGRRGLGLRYFLDHIATERLSGGAWACAVARQRLAATYRLATERQVGEESLWSRSAVRQRFGTLAARVLQLEALVREGLQSADETGFGDPLTSAAIKALVPEVMEDVIGFCLQLEGGRGFLRGSTVLRLLGEFRVFGVAGGSTETMVELVANQWAEALAADAPAT